MSVSFPTDLASILDRVDRIDPIAYGRTRNHLDGAVTYLSPYISRGVISTRFVLNHVLAKGYEVRAIESFVKELCWRDYFQRVQQHADIDSEIRQPQTQVAHHAVPLAFLTAQTGIDAVDEGIRLLLETGYMHNHMRMYTAMLACNIGRAHWREPARWMHHHLLDGDWASNACSWQWVAGANSSKTYIANQENINRFTGSRQMGTYLDTTYEVLESIPIPAALRDTAPLQSDTPLPAASVLTIDPTKPTLVYTSHNLDPFWHRDADANRILLLDPQVFARYPVSEAVMRFILDLRANIPGIQTYTGSFHALVKEHGPEDIRYKEHPLNIGFTGMEEPRDWIAKEVADYFPSFFAYWKQVSRRLG
jgi:deoxyribodipyrimidine photo-lyase